MLLVTGGHSKVYLAQWIDLKFNRLDRSADAEHRYGKKWMYHDRPLREQGGSWISIGPLCTIRWDDVAE